MMILSNLQPNQSLYCRVLEINLERFSCELTCRSVDLADKEGQYKPNLDECYNREAEARDRAKLTKKRTKQHVEPFQKRVRAGYCIR